MNLTMKRSSTWFYLLLFVCMNVQTILSGLEISYVKRVRYNGGNMDNRDKFGFVNNECPSYDASGSGSKHECECKTEYGTFLYIPKKCIKNSEIKPKSGCREMMHFEIENEFLVFDLNKTFTNQETRFSSKVAEIGVNCRVGQIKYLNDYDGLWKTPSISRSIFSIDTMKKKLTWSTASSLPRMLMGRVIYLKTQNCHVTLKWGSQKIMRNPCIAFKTEGTLNYSVEASNSIKTSTPSRYPSPSTGQFSTPTSAASIKSSASSQKSVPVEAIVGTILAIIAFIAIAIIVAVICRRRKQRKSQKPAKESVDCNNPEYGDEIINLSKPKERSSRSSDNEIHYDYAAIDDESRMQDNQATNERGPQVYQGLTKDQTGGSVYASLNREPGSAPNQAYTYNKMDRTLYDPQRKGPTDPLYNTINSTNLNNHEYLEPGEQISTNTPISIKDPPKNEPLYNTLEDPNQGGDKKDGEQDEPEYDVLEDPDISYDYAPVEGNTRPPTVCDNAGYEPTSGINTKAPPTDQEYHVLEGPSSEPSYQSLQIKPPDEVYQPLDRTSQNPEQPLYHVLEDKGNLSHA